MPTHRLPVADKATAALTAGRGLVDAPRTRGLVHYELLRGGRVIVPRTRARNGVTDGGKDYLLDFFFNAGPPVSVNWAVGLIDGQGGGMPDVRPDDYWDPFAPSTVRWAEATFYAIGGDVNYRGLWRQGPAAAQAVTNPLPVVYDFQGFTGTRHVTGVFVSTQIVKSSFAGLLWSTALFPAPLAVQSGDRLRVTYTAYL